MLKFCFHFLDPIFHFFPLLLQIFQEVCFNPEQLLPPFKCPQGWEKCRFHFICTHNADFGFTNFPLFCEPSLSSLPQRTVARAESCIRLVIPSGSLMIVLDNTNLMAVGCNMKATILCLLVTSEEQDASTQAREKSSIMKAAVWQLFLREWCKEKKGRGRTNFITMFRP